jgi:hypothetical protein
MLQLDKIYQFSFLKSGYKGAITEELSNHGYGSYFKKNCLILHSQMYLSSSGFTYFEVQIGCRANDLQDPSFGAQRTTCGEWPLQNITV